MNLKEYGHAVKHIHNHNALKLWIYYQSKKGIPSRKRVLAGLLGLFKDEAEFDEAISYLSERGFRVVLKD